MIAGLPEAPPRWMPSKRVGLLTGQSAEPELPAVALAEVWMNLPSNPSIAPGAAARRPAWIAFLEMASARSRALSPP